MIAYKIEHFEYRALPEGGVEILSVKDKSVTEAVIPTGVVRIGEGAFRDCAQLVTLYIPASVVFIGSHAFSGCAALYDVRYEGDKSGWIGLTVEVGNQIFSTVFMTFEAEALSKDDESVTKAESEVAAESDGKEEVKPVHIPKEKHKKIRGGISVANNRNVLITVAFIAVLACVSMLVVIFASKSTTSRELNLEKLAKQGYICMRQDDQVILTEYVGDNTAITIPDGVTKVGDYAFYECTSLKSVTIPDSVTSIGDGAFQNCTSLTSVTIPDSVKSIGTRAFYNCTSLTSVIIPDSVTSISSGALEYCTSLRSVTIGNGVTNIGNDSFAWCSSLISITVDPDNTAYTSINGNLYSKDGKTLIQYAIGKTDAEFIIADSATSIGIWAFIGCTTLTSITIPDSVTEIGFGAFTSCTSLTSITIPDSVTSIGDCAFSDCSSLTSITIPDSVTSIGSWAFDGCYSLTDVYYTGTEAQWNTLKYSIGSNNDYLLNANMHYNYIEE